MKASEISFLKFLKKSEQLTIPIYQRTYSWTERECEQLWKDIVRAGEDNRINSHFIGSVVYVEESISLVTKHSPFLVIDGQQRLTTVMLILEALARCVGSHEPFEGFSSDEIRYDYLLNHKKKGNRQFKLRLTQTDEKSLFALMLQEPLPNNHSLRIKENFDFFMHQMELNNNLAQVCMGLMKLTVVEIALNRDHDNPQLIFESMNSTGRELTQGDLIRNFLLMGLETDDQKHLYEDHWHPMEVSFGQKAYDEQFSRFIRYYLTLKNDGEIPVEKHVYETFKKHRVESKDTETVITDVHKYSDYYCTMALDPETNEKLGAVFSDLKELKADVAFPLLLKMYCDYENRLLDEKEFYQAVRTVESYVFRRAVCEIPTNSLNQTFSRSLRNINENRYLKSLQNYFLQYPDSSNRRFPRDREFREHLVSRNLYKFPRLKYFLRRLENHRRKESVSLSEYTVEHVMPQNPNLSPEWQDELGSGWRETQEQYLHTLGNLTLTGYNSEYRDRPFVQKRDMEESGFRHSPLWLNKDLATVKRWNKDAIRRRADRLAKRAIKVWSLPECS